MHSSWYSRRRMAALGTASRALEVSVASHRTCGEGLTDTVRLVSLMKHREQQALGSIPHEPLVEIHSRQIPREA